MSKYSYSGYSYCSVLNCRKNAKTNPELSFFRFPKDEPRCTTWITNSGPTKFHQYTSKYCYDHYKVCSLHFQDSMFSSLLKNRLKKNAIPTVFSNSEVIHHPKENDVCKSALPTAQESMISSSVNFKLDPYNTSVNGETEILYGMENITDIKTLETCRTCMNEIIHTSSFFHLDSTQAATEATFRHKLYKCIPELDLSVTTDAVICGTCANIINSVYEFKNECLQSEMKIHKYIQQMQHTDDVINLAQVTQFHQQQCENFTLKIKTEVLEIKTEDIEMKEDFKTEELAVSNYDANAFNDVSKITESTKEEHSLQNVTYNMNESYPTCSMSTMEENLETNDNTITGKNLKPNMKIHTLDKLHKCSVCKYHFNNKNSLKTHMFSHTGEKPFKCSVCDYQFYTKSNLKQHIQIHTGQDDGLFSCSVCAYRSSDRSTFKRHTLIHTGELFTCTICEYRTDTKRNLKNHMFFHTGEKPFKCSVCDYRCSFKSSLKRHIQAQNHMSSS